MEVMRSELVAELSEAELGDARLTKRLGTLVTSLVGAPDRSFPEAAATDSELEGTYRFLRNESVKPEAILAPHVRGTVRRAAEEKTVVVAHDTTEFSFGKTQRKGLGRVGRGKSFGFYGHFALAVSTAESRRPLGLLGLTTVFRDGNKTRAAGVRLDDDSPANESARWKRLVEDVEQQLGGEASAVHVMDRQADSYQLLVFMQQRAIRFAIRVCHVDRLLATGEVARTVEEAMDLTSVIAEREVPLGARGNSSMPTYRKLYPPRQARLAKLHVRARTVRIPKSKKTKSETKSLTVNVVQVSEVDPPAGAEPVSWTLWTSEPVATPEQALAVVDYYRRRWVIEEFFKALKSGCAYESRQLESKHSLLNALAVLAPIAWTLLSLRSASRVTPQLPGTRILSDVQLRCLRFAMAELHKQTLPEAPTIAEVTLGIARLGGHIRNNGEPGWIVLGRGYEKLLTVELGFHLATAALASAAEGRDATNDQS